MLLNILYNFCILATFSILIYWPFLNHKENPIIYRFHSYIIGLNFGVAGLIVTILSSQVAFGIMINSRIIPLLFSGLLGGPIALLISGLIMGIGRLFLSDITSYTLVLINTNFILLVFVLFFFGKKYPYTEQNIFHYFWIITVETSCVILAFVIFHNGGFPLLFLYTLFTVISFFLIYIIVNQIKNATKKIHDAKYLSKTDYLTQLPNNAEIEKYILDSLAKKTTFTLLLLHINDFKRMNSTYGFQFGDIVIERLAQNLHEYVNKNGAFAGKLSGEEFIIVLKDVAPAIATKEAYAINKWNYNLPFETQQGQTIHIKTSIGLATYPDNGEDYHSLIKSLINAQYYAKTELQLSYFHANNLKK